MIKRIRCFALFLIGLAILSLTGCSVLETTNELVTGVGSYFLGGEDNKEPPAELVEYKKEIQIVELWSENVSEGEGEEHFLNLLLAISDEKALVADIEGLVQARDIKTGDLIWETETEYSFSAGPGIGEKIAVLATTNAEIIAIDIETGEKKWNVSVSSEVLANPVVANGIVLVRTTDGKMIALSRDDGSQMWVFEKNVPALSIRGTGTPIVVDENIIAGYATGKLLALRVIDGKSGWETSIDIPSGRSEVERLVDLDVDPVETNGSVFIASYQGGTTSVLAVDGDVLWRNEYVSSYTGISYDWRYLYISDTRSHVWQLDQRNGASLWKQDELFNRRLTAPVLYSEYVVVGDFDGYVHWLAGSDGRQLGRIKVADSAIEAKPVVVDDVVYVYSKDGTLTALKANLF
ncbi:MAG: outer membrane protein assembly factor BamB [Methylococcales bacterium]|nr:outer membrane protein assembly factor BamB [Methylococcales bacterium]